MRQHGNLNNMATKDISDVQVVQAYQAKSDKYPHELLMEQTGQPEKVCYAACERAARRGLIDYGVSLRTGWITEKGKSLL